MHQPDVTLMDLQMPEMSGLDALIAIRNEFPDAKIIVLTTYAGDMQIVRALKAGAQAYLLKNTSAQGIDGDNPCRPRGKEGPFSRGVIRNRRTCDG